MVRRVRLIRRVRIGLRIPNALKMTNTDDCFEKRLLLRRGSEERLKGFSLEEASLAGFFGSFVAMLSASTWTSTWTSISTEHFAGTMISISLVLIATVID